MKRIAIQGLIGSFHDIAAHLYFEGEQIQLICCSTFEQVFDSIKQDPTAIGMLAIENTIAGSLLHNYELLRDSGTTVVGEHKLHITHSICCLPEDDWDTITEVHSHPVALMQCRQFLAQHPQLKNVEAEDTAGSAKMIAEGQHRGWAAICHAEAARLYGLKVLDMLRPLLETNKSSIVFSLPHEEGSLSHVLAILSFYKINLTKIQSLPIIGREWEYLFYVDVMYDDLTRYRQSIDAIIPLTKDLKILGEYKDGKQTN